MEVATVYWCRPPGNHAMSATPALTKNQELVLGALEKAEGPLSAYTILDALRDDGLRAPLQVYRALDKLLDFVVSDWRAEFREQ